MLTIHLLRAAGNSDLPLPTRATSGSAGFDLRVGGGHSVTIPTQRVVLIGTGWCWEIPAGYVGKLHLRSSLAKCGLALANGVGVVDSDYRGEVMVALHNYSDVTIHLSPGERIAQLLVERVLTCHLIAAPALSSTPRGAGGFGSTGTL